ncbi:helix-turn-helix domain-containing protein [Streptomyces synnematoformans]|uniref:HTH cro/C1-type domain-containing protein n=1 Tax=Streptomyces synnematoformans TaxID=415721 RepID=A0ABN2Y3X0_9ACTN
MTAEHSPLVSALRELRARTGLSLAALAARTTYSKSSWERYLSGKSLPSRQAVREMCRVADEPDGRLLALWEIAESERSGRAAVSAPAAAEPPPEVRARRSRMLRSVVVLASVYTVLAGGAAAALYVLSARDAPDGEPLAAAAPYSVSPRCLGATCEGRDPMRLICGVGPETLTAHRTATGARIELRHSATCGASWARTWGTRIGDRLEVTAGGPAHDVRVRNRDDTETYVYTAMTETPRGSSVRACFHPANPAAPRECVEARVP